MEIDEARMKKVARLRNLKVYRGKSDEELLEVVLRKERQQEAGVAPAKTDSTPEQKYKELFRKLQSEYSVDMNESNDVEALKMLAKHIIQRESIDKQINDLSSRENLSNEDTRTLKNLADVQRSIVTSITELQDRLGISRKARKEKSSDDLPAFIEGLKKKAADYWERQTVKVVCDTCKVELARYWLNFPQKNAIVTMELECGRCHQNVMYVR